MANWFNVLRSRTMMLASEAEPVLYTYKTVLNIYFLHVLLIMNFSLPGTHSFMYAHGMVFKCKMQYKRNKTTAATCKILNRK